MDNEIQLTDRWCENVIIADGDYVDAVAFDLTVNFERMLGRRIAKADLARWIDCVALDGGVRPGHGETQVVLLHAPDKPRMENFTPGDYRAELDGKAFSDNLGEFRISAYQVERMVSADDFLVDIVEHVCNHADVRRVMIIPNAEHPGLCDDIRRALRHVDEDKRVTLLAMQPVQGGNFRQEILGYSLMSALGISGEELGTGEE